jgi:stage V sporulation protein R
MNEGWASYWHEALFLEDDRIKGEEVGFARVHAGVTAMPRVGLNPYALGMRLFQHIEDLYDKGRYSMDFRRLRNRVRREGFDRKEGRGKEFIFEVRENFCDYTFVTAFLDQDFVDRHQLFVSGKRLNRDRMVWEYFVKSRKAEDYRGMIEDHLYHPPHIEVDENGGDDNTLRLIHRFEGKPLVKEFIANTMLGIEYLWGAPVQLETSEVVSAPTGLTDAGEEVGRAPVSWQRVLYTMKDRKLTKRNT